MNLFNPPVRQCLFVAALALVWAGLAWTWPPYLYLQSDTFWLVETGRYILAHHGLPAHEVFSFTRQGEPWIVYQWLFEVLLAALFRTGGWLLVSLSATLLVAWLFFVGIFRASMRLGAEPSLAVLVLGLAVVAGMPDIVAVRPQLLSFVLLWLTATVLERAWAEPPGGKGHVLVWLVPIALVWSNVHLSFIIEPALVALYLLCALWRRDGAGSRRWQVFAVASGAVLVTSLLNPYGIGLYAFLWESWQDRNITPELRPLDWLRSPVLSGYIVVTLVGISATARRFSLPRLLAAAGFLFAGLAGARFLLYLIVWTAGMLAESSGALSAQPDGTGPLARLSAVVHRSAFSPGYGLAVLACVAATTWLRPLYFPSTIPVAAADYLARHPPEGPLFCGENAGSYLIFRFRGRLKVFIDTRADVYKRAFVEEYRRAMLFAQGWQELFDRFEIRFALVPRRYRLHEELARSPQWREVYSDRFYAVFERGLLTAGGHAGTCSPTLSLPRVSGWRENHLECRRMSTLRARRCRYHSR